MATQKRCPHGHCQRTPAIFSSPKGLFLSATELTARQTHPSSAMTDVCNVAMSMSRPMARAPRHSQLRCMALSFPDQALKLANTW